MNNPDLFIYILIGLVVLCIILAFYYYFLISVGKKSMKKTNDLLAAIAKKLGVHPEDVDIIMNQDKSPTVK